MTVTAIIAEYNPFHNGHLYQIEEARRLTKADYIIVIMSGNFVQRGAPAIMDKYARAQCALEGGADLVLELPVLWSTSSADYFARGAISILDGLNMVDYLCFGCECDSLSLLYTAADLFYNEPAEFKEALSNHLKSGLSFPIARAQAARSFLKTHADLEDEAVETILSLINEPNNILAISYLSALMALSSPIKPVPVKRLGQGYHDEALKEDFSSATAIRNALNPFSSDKRTEHDSPASHFGDDMEQIKQQLSKNVPPQTFERLLEYLEESRLVYADDFSAMLSYRLLSTPPSAFAEFADAGTDLANRTGHLIPEFLSFSDFCTLLKTKQITHTRISRYLTHILLNITERFRQEVIADAYSPYARILGFKKTSSSLVSHISRTSRIPVLTNLNADMEGLSKTELEMLNLDLFASDLYRSVLTEKTGRRYPNEFTRTLLVL